MTNNNNLYQSWLKDNLWNLIVTFAAVILTYATLQTHLAITEAKVNILENTMAEYPSKDYFEEKFKNTDQKIEELKTDFKEHINQK